MNGHFIMSARKHGIDARLFNILENDPPQADYIVMLSSFYHFRDQKERLFETLMGAANKTLILSEPVVNLSEHSSGALASLANRLTNPGSMSGQKVGNYKDRYDLESFEKFAKSHNCSAFLKHEDSNNAIAVFTK